MQKDTGQALPFSQDLLQQIDGMDTASRLVLECFLRVQLALVQVRSQESKADDPADNPDGDAPNDPTGDLDRLRQIARQAQAGDARAQYQLACIYDEGSLVSVPSQEIVRLVRASAAGSFAPAQYALYTLLRDGDRMARDPAQAAHWLSLAAHQGHVCACFELGMAFLHGDGVSQDDVQARHWIGLAAEQGHAQAQHVLHVDGVGMQPVDPRAALQWMQQAAREGNPHAQFGLGLAYHLGTHGLKIDPVQALRWMLLAELHQLDQEMDQPMGRISNVLRMGRGMTPKQLQQATDLAAQDVLAGYVPTR